MDYQQPHRYMRPPPPPPPPSMADPHHHHQPLPPPGPWYPGQFHYQPPPSQYSPSPPPPPPHQQWPPPPQYAPQPPPYPSHPLHNQYPPPPPPPPPSHRPPVPPPYHPHSQIPQSYPQDWGNANWGHHQGWEYPVHSNEEDWAAKARAWAAAKVATDDQHSQSQYTPVGRPEEQSHYHDQYTQTADPHYPDVAKPSLHATSYQQYPPPAAPPHRPPMVHLQESASINSGQSSFVPDEHLAYSARDGNLAGDPNAVFPHQESSPTSSSVHLQEVPSSYSSVTGKEEAGDQNEKFYKSFPDSSQGPHHMLPPLPAIDRSVKMDQRHYAVGNQSSEAPIDLSDQPLVFTHRSNHNHDPLTQANYMHTDSGGLIRGVDHVAAAPSNHTWTSPVLPGAVYPPIPPMLQSGQQHDTSLSSPVPGHSAPMFGRMPGASFQPTIPSVGPPFGIGAGSGLHPTAAFPGDVYGVPSVSERPKKASVPNWLREEIIKKKAVIVNSTSECPKEEIESIEDEEAVDNSLGIRLIEKPWTLLDLLKKRMTMIRIEIEDTTVNGTFNMMFLGYSISLGYKNHRNIIMRISSVGSQDNDPSVLVNGHFDSPLGSPGAGDCGSCVASMLEIARLTVDSGWVPPRPIIFLFNGAEELFMLGSHGFMTSHKWRDTIGAFINVEASGTGGLDLVCQSGPGSWPSLVYAQSALYPMANSAAQDVFPVIPGDTDYRIFANDYGKIPGLDVIFLLGGYFYHTSFDTVERLLPGSIQVRGDNLFSVIKAFTNSSKLQNALERESLGVAANESDNERAVFFDYLAWFLIFYSRKQAVVLHSIPVAIYLFMPFLLRLANVGLSCSIATFYDFIKGMLVHATGIILAVLFPVICAILRLLVTGHSMNWFAHPFLAFMMFVPCSLIGLLIPRIVWRCFPLSQDVSVLKASREELADEARFWGAFGFYAVLTAAYLVAGLSGGFLTFSSSVFMLPAWICFCLSLKSFGRQSLRSIACYVVPLIPCLAYSVYFGGFIAQFLIEKMGMMGSLPPPHGYFVPDIVVAALTGVVTSWCVGPLIPVLGHWLARSAILQFLLQLIVISMALSSRFFPYSIDAPKRVVFQHTVLTTDASHIVDTNYEFSVVDSNSLLFVFKHAPEVAKELHICSELSFETANFSHQENWMAIYPVSFFFSRSLKFSAKSDEVLKEYRYFPHLSSYKPQTISGSGSRKVYLELSLGSLKEVWVAVLNITGPLSNWSLANNVLPAPERLNGGPPSYMCRLSGASNDNWTFWLEANSTEALRIEVAVLDQYLLESTKKLRGLFPDWVDVTAYSSFMSSYGF